MVEDQSNDMGHVFSTHQTAMMRAVKKDSENCVFELIKAGADVNNVNEEVNYS